MRTRSLRPIGLLTLLALLTALAVTPANAQQRLTTPESEFGHRIGADYVLPDYTALQTYWQRLASESDRMRLEVIGKTEQGRDQLMAIITSPTNHQRLARYKEISSSLARARGITEQQAHALAREGKAVVWIDGGLHATEVLGAQQLMETVWQLVSRTDAETMRILDEVIVLAVHANPDGMELVSDWYMRNEDPMHRSSGGVPVLYQEYAGHDNNRDSYMANLAETENMNRIAYREWYPQILYNHHQTGPRGAVMFAPPFREPANHYIDPMVITGLDQVGAAMHARFVREGKGGTVSRSKASYSTWWNGGVRTVGYYHNIIGLLTETIGNPTPQSVPFIPDRFMLESDAPLAVEPGEWHFRQSVDYSVTANYAVLDYASRNKDHLLFNIWRMGMNSIERGSRDSWTMYPSRIAAAEEALRSSRGGGGGGGFGRGGGAGAEQFEELLRAPEDRDPRGYILPADQADFPTATKFVNALLKNGIEVHRATRAFGVAGEQYPAGSFVVRCDQAFRPFVLDMFEKQDHPNDFAYPGAPPTPPYDSAGWTLAFQMGVEFDRVMEGFEGPFEMIEGIAAPMPGRVSGPRQSAGYLLSHQVNDAFIAVNRTLGSGGSVWWLRQSLEAGGRTWPAGTFYIASRSGTRAALEGMATELGLEFVGVPDSPPGEALQLRPVRIGLWDRYGGSMDSGWIRFMLERFEFDFRLVFPKELDAGGLDRDFDVLIFPGGAIPSGDRGGRGFGGQDESSIPEQYRDRLGSVSVETTVPKILEFIRSGGAVITLGSSTALGEHAGLPLRDHLVRETAEGPRPLSRTEYYVPTSVLRVKLEHATPLTDGMSEYLDTMFSNSEVFAPFAPGSGLVSAGWFDTATPLRSGWAWGQEHLEDGVVFAEAQVGSGRLFLFGPDVTFRAQPHASFPLVFNGIYYGTATPGRVR